MIRLATFNLFWFPGSAIAGNARGPDDRQRIAQVVARLDCDAIAFQEILDPAALQQTLDLVPGRTYRVVQGDAGFPAGDMRVAVAFDEATLDLLESVELIEPDPARRFNGRKPLAVCLRDRGSQKAFWLVGAHLKSGLPTGNDPTPGVDQKRLWEGELLATWLGALPTDGPDRRPAFLLGDFNLVAGQPALATFGGSRGPAKMVPAKVVAALADGAGAPAPVPPEEAWSTLLDGVIIDHAFCAAGGDEWVTGDALVYAFDLDPHFAEPRDAHGTPFFRVTHGAGVRLRRFAGAPVGEVRAMYRVSDHRPVRVEIQPT
jgi:endonuclease/exonuclease/phosphatase family metal-dependent hydrolase